MILKTCLHQKSFYVIKFNEIVFFGDFGNKTSFSLSCFGTHQVSITTTSNIQSLPVALKYAT